MKETSDNFQSPPRTASQLTWLISTYLLILLSTPTHAQTTTDPNTDPTTPIEAAPEQSADQRIAARLSSIYEQIDALNDVSVDVREGVVLLSGAVSNDAAAERAVTLAARIEGVVTVDDGIERRLDVKGNVAPMLDTLAASLERWLRALPLIGISLIVFTIVAFLGHRLAGWDSLWRRVSPNPFLAELVAQAVRVVSFIVGLVIALNLMGATALMATILGGAGVAGLAIGFAVRDTMENYISSIMLSLRQPFRANDHVVINDREGKVVRLTSRATVLMTLDGNHLRIPNSTVYKSVILNYSTNPERRFDFELGIDADDDPVAAMKVALDAVAALPFTLEDPGPDTIISAVGDSNIVLKIMAWIDQRDSDYGKARSLAIRAAKSALEAQGFSLPEPIYRLRLDTRLSGLVASDGNRSDAAASVAAVSMATDQPESVARPTDTDEVLDVRPDTHLEDKVNEERAQDPEADLLDSKRPTE